MKPVIDDQIQLTWQSMFQFGNRLCPLVASAPCDADFDDILVTDCDKRFPLLYCYRSLTLGRTELLSMMRALPLIERKFRLFKLIGRTKRRAIRYVEHLTGDGPTIFHHVC
jgi:hypothetical protein